MRAEDHLKFRVPVSLLPHEDKEKPSARICPRIGMNLPEDPVRSSALEILHVHPTASERALTLVMRFPNPVAYFFLRTSKM